MAASGSDFDIFSELFGNFELFLPLMDGDEDTNNIPDILPCPDIQNLLDLPYEHHESDFNLDLTAVKPETDMQSEPSLIVTAKERELPVPVPNLTTVTQSDVPELEPLIADNTIDTQSDTKIKTENDPQPDTFSRFKRLTDEDLAKMRENKYAAKTKANTKWGVNLFQGKHYNKQMVVYV